MPRIRLTIDSHPIVVYRHGTILEAAETAGIFIPSLCHLPGYPPRAVCRLCLVQVEGIGTLQQACTRPVENGMRVHVRSPELARTRRVLGELLLAEHGQCSRTACEVEAAARLAGARTTPYVGSSPRCEREPLSDYLSMDPGLCVRCDRCIRACSRLGVLERQGPVQTGVPHFSPSSCIGCGDCVAACPSGALDTSSHSHP